MTVKCTNRCLTPITRMEKSSTRLVVYITLITLSCVLMSLGIFWLGYLGLALLMLAGFAASQKPDSSFLVGFLVFSVIAVGSLIWDLHESVAFVQKTRPLWFFIGIGFVWILSVIIEFWRWHKRG